MFSTRFSKCVSTLVGIFYFENAFRQYCRGADIKRWCLQRTHVFNICHTLYIVFSKLYCHVFGNVMFLNYVLNDRLLYFCWCWLCENNWISCPLCSTSRPIVCLNFQLYIGNHWVHLLRWSACMHFGQQ